MKVHTVVVGYDGSHHAREAVEAAIGLVSDDGIVHIVTAYRPMSNADIADIKHALPPEFQHAFDPAADQENHLADAALMVAEQGIEHQCHLVADDPATAILDIADQVDADLIVVGSRGLGAIRRFIRGSVSSRVATHAPTSVLVVHDQIGA